MLLFVQSYVHGTNNNCGAAEDVNMSNKEHQVPALHYILVIYELALKSNLTFWQVFRLFPLHKTEEYIILS